MYMCFAYNWIGRSTFERVYFMVGLHEILIPCPSLNNITDIMYHLAFQQKYSNCFLEIIERVINQLKCNWFTSKYHFKHIQLICMWYVCKICSMKSDQISIWCLASYRCGSMLVMSGHWKWRKHDTNKMIQFSTKYLVRNTMGKMIQILHKTTTTV